MYKCKECGAEYEEKPDYCDCGNDEFELVSLNNAESTIYNQGYSEEPVLDIVYNDEPKKYEGQEIVETNIAEEKPKAQAASAAKSAFMPPPQKKSFNEQYPGLSSIIASVDPLSMLFFCVCIILSFYVVFFAWGDNETVNESDINTKNQQIVDVKNIPEIDKFWNNTPPVYKKPEVKKENHEENLINQVANTVVPQKTPVQKTIQVQKPVQTVKPVQTTKPAVTKVTLYKTAQPAKQKTTTTTSKQQSTINTQVQAQKAAEAAAKKKAEQERLAAEAAQLQKLKAEQAKKAAEEKARKEAAAKQEYANYKVQLRNTIGRKIDFTRVIGDGSCTVAFKIDSTGRLVSRSFAKQSSNNTLNDAVYAAVMATPSFNPPPSGYNNETLNLNIKFYNGNFEISLP